MNQALKSELDKIPFSKSFSGHETFAFRYSWLKKGVDLLTTDPEIFQHADAGVAFGVGKNMVRSIRHWCLATRMAEEEPGSRSRLLHPTELGKNLLLDSGWDPYLEDDATLWLIHWNLASEGTRTATWYWAFNQFQEYAFNKILMIESLVRDIESIGWSGVSPSTLKRDVDCFIQSYLGRKSQKTGIDESIECPLTNLGILIQEPDSERLRFRMGPKESLPPAIFAYALVAFWKAMNRSKSTLELRDILRSQGSPGLVFKLDQETVLNYLDSLNELTSGLMFFEDTPLIRRVVKLKDFPNDPLFLLKDYYGGE